MNRRKRHLINILSDKNLINSGVEVFAFIIFYLRIYEAMITGKAPQVVRTDTIEHLAFRIYPTELI
jgi:hypothetical protein